VRSEHVHFFEERRQVEHYAVADDARLAAHDAAGDEVQNILDAVGHNCMAGVGTTLETRHDISAFAQQVDDAAFSLIAPLRADNY
jgi:hypothetical protein